MLTSWNSIIVKLRSITQTVLHPLFAPQMQPRRIPIPVETNPRHRLPDRSHPNAYSRIQPPSTTQL